MNDQVKSEKKLRREMLAVLDAARGGERPVNGHWLAADVLGVDDEDVVRLGQDLVNLGMATLTDTRTTKWQSKSARFMELAITAKGTRLLAGLEAVEPLIEDERI